jgi:hypothetical protein
LVCGFVTGHWTLATGHWVAGSSFGIWGGGRKSLEGVEGAVEGSFGLGLVAAEEGKGFLRVEEDGSQVGAGEVAVFFLTGLGAQVLEAGAEDAGFGQVHAALAPESHHELFHEGLLGGALGGKVFQEGVAEGVELVGVLVGEYGQGGGEAVF